MTAKNKYRRLLIAFWAVLIILIFSFVAFVFTVYKLNSTNLFSKNISLDSTWILSIDGSGSEKPQLYQEEVSNPFYAAEVGENQTIINEYNSIMSKYYEISQYQSDLSEEMKNYYMAMGKSVGDFNLTVPFVAQGDDLPNGCESVCASMLLKYNDFDITPQTFINDYLKCEPVKIRWGCRYGPNPSKAYAGDPYSKKGGWGCFAPVIVDALNQCLQGELKAVNLTGTTLDELVALYISRGIPVAMWTTQKMESIEKAYQWQSYDKTETFLYPVNQHCMVLTGFNANDFYFSDPLSSGETQIYDKDTVEKSFRSMGSQAVAIIKK